MTLQTWQDIAGYTKREFRAFCGLLAAVCSALSQAQLPIPWNHRVSWICIAAGAAYVYMTKPFQSRDAWGASAPDPEITPTPKETEK